MSKTPDRHPGPLIEEKLILENDNQNVSGSLFIHKKGFVFERNDINSLLDYSGDIKFEGVSHEDNFEEEYNSNNKIIRKTSYFKFENNQFQIKIRETKYEYNNQGDLKKETQIIYDKNENPIREEIWGYRTQTTGNGTLIQKAKLKEVEF